MVPGVPVIGVGVGVNGFLTIGDVPVGLAGVPTFMSGLFDKVAGLSTVDGGVCGVPASVFGVVFDAICGGFGCCGTDLVSGFTRSL